MTRRILVRGDHDNDAAFYCNHLLVPRDQRAPYPCGLPRWRGHKRIDETMLYVQFAEVHMRPLPETILAAGRGSDDPDRRVIAMLSARQNGRMNGARCSQVAAEEGSQKETAVISLV